MAENSGEVKVYNTARQEAEHIVFPILESHKHAITQARTGELQGVPFEKIGKSQRKLNRVKALHLIISCQKDMIHIARPTVRYKSLKDWERSNNEEGKETPPFEEVDNYYNRLMEIRRILNFFDNEIINAEKSATKEDDFLIEKQGADGEDSELTQNFYEMLDELEDTSESISVIMIRHNIISAGISEDEELTYKEQEKLFIERVKEA